MIEKTIKQYFLKRKEIAAVYLFGSYASGKEHHMSDVDIGILLTEKHLQSGADFKQDYIIELGRYLRKDIHPVIMNTAGELILKQILCKGKLIYVMDQKFNNEFKRIALTKIYDFNFYLEKMHSSLKNQILKA